MFQCIENKEMDHGMRVLRLYFPAKSTYILTLCFDDLFLFFSKINKILAKVYYLK